MQTQNEKEITNTTQFPFLHEFSQYLLTYTKDEILEIIKCHQELFVMYLDTEYGDDLDQRREMLASTLKIKELADIINCFSLEEIQTEALIIVGDE